jgi:phytoene dehydrogenase-like protein
MRNYDVIIIGAGINGLATAAILGKAGKHTLVLESRNKVGGMASSMEFAPGYKCNVFNDTIKWIDPRLEKLLKLSTKGLELEQPEILKIALGENNKHIAFHKKNSKTVESIARYSKNDSKKWEEFSSYISKLAHFLEKLYGLTPPSLPNAGLKEILGMRSMLGSKHRSHS